MLIFRNQVLTPVFHQNEYWLGSDQLAIALEYQGSPSVNRIYRQHRHLFADSMICNSRWYDNNRACRQTRLFSLQGALIIASLSRSPFANKLKIWLNNMTQHNKKTAKFPPPPPFDPHLNVKNNTPKNQINSQPVVSCQNQHASDFSSCKQAMKKALEQVFVLANEVGHAIIDTMIEKKESTEHAHWLLGYRYDAIYKKKVPYAQAVAPNALMLSFAELIHAITAQKNCWATDQELLDLITACQSRLLMRQVS